MLLSDFGMSSLIPSWINPPKIKSTYKKNLNMMYIGGEIVKQDERYIVRDNPFGNNLVLSSTQLFGFKETTGHKHEGQEEVYLFLDGIGEMQLDNEIFPIKTGDVIPIKDGVFHKVYNRSADDLFFICIFDGARTK